MRVCSCPELPDFDDSSINSRIEECQNSQWNYSSNKQDCPVKVIVDVILVVSGKRHITHYSNEKRTNTLYVHQNKVTQSIICLKKEELILVVSEKNY
jgi:hypothetical protein